MNRKTLLPLLIAPLFASTLAQASVDLIAIGNISGTYQDLALQTAAPLENGVAGNRLGGIGSGLAYAGGSIFLALPDRGPNANPYNPLVDDTVSYIDRFHTFSFNLAPSEPGSMLPFTLTPILRDTTLLSSARPLVYGSGVGLDLGSGEPALNAVNHTHYFTGRSDNFDPSRPSTNPNNARLDPEAIRVARNGNSVFISDEYGPYVHQFDRKSGKRINSFKLPDNLAISTLSPQKDVEIDNNAVGRVTNKGMEGLAITPDGRMLVGFMQANLEQDKKKSLRIVTIDIKRGTTHEYAYKLTDGSGVSEIVAVNDHQFLVDERDGSGMADAPGLDEEASAAEVKKLYLIDLNGAEDISGVTGPNADLSSYAVPKIPFLDIVAKLKGAGIDPLFIPSKIEGLAFGQDVVIDGKTRHTLFISNDNDFLAYIADPTKMPGDASRGYVENPNLIYVFAFGDSDLPGYVPQAIDRDRDFSCYDPEGNNGDAKDSGRW
ncbi:MAG: pyruvate-binding protein [Thiobacillus sp.]|nr:pyruvate-binding protein [Thiobacillus sp.]